MSRYKKIVWNEGMLLTPHHFQQWDNYYEELLRSRLSSIEAYYWGVLLLEMNEEAIANGSCELVRCRAVMPDGLLVNVPVGEAAPAPRPVGNAFSPGAESLSVYLAVPAMRAGAVNYQTNGGDPAPTIRYLQEAGLVQDETTGRNEQQVAFARSNLRLMFEGELRDG